MTKSKLIANGYVILSDGDKDAVEEASIANDETNQKVNMGDVAIGSSISIDNDNSVDGHNITLRFNSTSGPARTIKAGESKSWSNFTFTNVYLSNSSGVEVNYRIDIQGFSS